MTDLINVLGQPQGTPTFDEIRISIASPERIRALLRVCAKAWMVGLRRPNGVDGMTCV